MIKAVLLDLDDTLITTNSEQFFPLYLHELDRHAAGLTAPEPFLPSLMAAFEATLSAYEPTRSLYDRLQARLATAVGVDRGELEGVFDAFYEEKYPALGGHVAARNDAVTLLNWLFSAGCRVVVATNPGLPAIAIRRRMQWGGIDPDAYPFDLITSLEEMHFGKPHADYYAEIVTRLEIEPGEAIMVGDDWEADLVGAGQAGLHTFWIAPDGSSLPDDRVAPAGVGSLSSFVERVCTGWLETLECEDADRTALQARLCVFPGAVDAVSGVYGSAILECRPGEEEWSVRDIVCHLREHELSERERLERILNEDNPFLSAEAGRRDANREYRTGPFVKAFDAFTTQRARTVAWLEGLPAGAWERPARDAIFGPTYFEEMVGFIVEHDRTHLRQMRTTIDEALRICE
jgi:FMN phosphatase YigB (HAD superfamily)